MAVLKNIVSKIFNLSTTPAKKTEGQFWYDTTNNVLKRSDGADYKPLAIDKNTVGNISLSTILNSKANTSDLSNYLKKTGDLHLELGYKNTDYDSQTDTPSITVGGQYSYDDDFNFVEWWNRYTEITDLGIIISGEVYGSPDIDTISLNRSTGITVSGDARQSLINHNTIALGTKIYNFETGTYEFTNPVFKVHTDDGITGTFIDTNLSTELEDGHIATSKAIKSYVDTSVSNKANASDLTNYLPLTGGIIQNTSLTGSYEKQTTTTLNGNYIEIANRFSEPVWTKIKHNSIEINSPDSDSLTFINEQSFSTGNGIGSSFLINSSIASATFASDSSQYAVNIGTLGAGAGYGTPQEPGDFYGLNIGHCDTGEFDISNVNTFSSTIFKVGYIFDEKLEYIPEISGSLVDKSISSSSLDTHIPTSKAVYTALDNKQDKLQYYTEVSQPCAISQIKAEYTELGDTSSGTYIAIDGFGSDIISLNASNGFEGSGIATTLGTSTTSAKLPTEGAVVKAISDVKTSLGSALTYEGSVTNYSNLPTGLTTSDKGKVYNVVNANGDIPAGTNYAWNGTSWDALGGDLSAYQLKTDQSLTTTSKQIVGAINEINLKLDITTGPTPITSVYTVDNTTLQAFITNTQYANVQGKITISPSIDNAGAVYFGQSITDKSQAFPLYPGQIMSFSFTDINTFMCATDTVGNKFNYVVEFGVVNKEPVMDSGIIIRSATGENYKLIPVTDEDGNTTLEIESLAKIDSEQLAKYFEESTPNVKELTLVNGSEESQTVLQDKQGNILYTV